MYDLSIIIPARNEEFLQRTIDDALQNIEGNTEIIVVLDGYKPEPVLRADSRIVLIYHSESIGQRAAANEAAKISQAKYLMKIDAHCAFDKGFDAKMMADMQDDWTMVPIMRNLHVFDWVCPEGHRRYQGPSGPCADCGKPTIKDVVWIAKTNPSSTSYRFDKTMHFQYWGEYKEKQLGDLVESMSIQGSCFMCTREKYFELDLCSEEFNSWGQQGVEVACKTWLSGGRVMITKKTWYAHMFRTQGGDFGFPYQNPQSKVNENREISRQLFQYDKWPKAIHKFRWLLDKFNPPEWDSMQQGPTKGMIYYTHNQLDEKIARPVRDQLSKISQEKGIPIVSASLKKMDFGVKNIRFPSFRRGYLAMFKQILGALENSSADIIFFCEHDILYHPSHFDFMPPSEDTFYYNQNVWYLRASDGHCLHYDVNQLSGLCGYRSALMTHFRERFVMADEEYKKLQATDGPNIEHDFDRFVRHIGFEPMTHGRVAWKNVFKYESWKSEYPNVDIRYGENATGQRWKKEQFKNQKLLVNWEEGDAIPYWGKGKDIAETLV